jgi:putative glutamine amidotransferase
MAGSMPNEAKNGPRVVRPGSPQVGIPWRTAKEERENNVPKMANYYRAVEDAGGVAVPISLQLSPAELERLAQTLDAIVLPGSPTDVDPARYGAARHPACADADRLREDTDYALLDDAFAAGKPVLAICYGVQSLNVYLGGTLVQDIPSELRTEIPHSRHGLPPGTRDPRHGADFEADSRLAALAGALEAEVNSSHHQSIARPGRNLRVTAHAPDGVIEAVELDDALHWVSGVQWHPERMAGDALAAALFGALVQAARAASVRR